VTTPGRATAAGLHQLLIAYLPSMAEAYNARLAAIAREAIFQLDGREIRWDTDRPIESIARNYLEVKCFIALILQVLIF
jgi:hypothetical protein